MKCEECVHERVCDGYSNCEEVGLCEPKRQHGEWIKEHLQIDEHHFRSFAKCEICGCKFKPYSFAVKEFDFCPKCGADMRKEGEAE